MHDTKINLGMVYVLCLFLVIWSGGVRCIMKNNNYTLDKTYAHTTFNIWGFAHFLMYIFIGYYFPAHFTTAFVVGCLWELTEWYISVNEPSFLIGIANNSKMTEKCTWWQPKFTDIFFNTAGFLVGCRLRNIKKLRTTVDSRP